MSERRDVVIVGSRLAGACAAAHLARAGRTVVALDRLSFPSDQLSTHLLMPAGVDELRRMGALDAILAANPTRSPWLELAVDSGTEHAARVLERWRPSGETDYCLCVPRPIQDVELVRAARAAGAEVRERHRFLDVLWRGGRAVGVRYADPSGTEHELYADLVLGADGRRSSVAAAVGAFRPYRASRNGRGLVFRYVDDPLAGQREGHTIYQWRDGDSFGFLFPSAPSPKALLLFMGRAEEAAEAKRDPEGYWTRKLAEHPAMRERVRDCTNPTPLRTTGDTSAYFRASSGPGWALIGDAGHFKDPVTGQGQRDALWAGRRVAELVEPVLGDPAALDAQLRRWEAERDRECVHAYHFANLDTDVRTVSPVLTEIVRRTSRTQTPDLGDLFGRERTLPQILSLPALVTGLADALRRGTGTGRGDTVRDAVADLRVHLGIRHDLLGRRFRSTRTVPGSEHPDPNPPALPTAGRRAPRSVSVGSAVRVGGAVASRADGVAAS
jgi:flavin-dependent dehydrogenase